MAFIGKFRARRTDIHDLATLSSAPVAQWLTKPTVRTFNPANSVTIIRTSDRTSAAITEWPTEAIRDDAELKINEVRNKVHKDDHLRMTGEMRGEIVADL